MRPRLRRPAFDTHLSLWLDTAIVNIEQAQHPWERRFWRRVKRFVERRIGL
jgi:hypothetical protein